MAAGKIASVGVDAKMSKKKIFGGGGLAVQHMDQA